MMTGVPRKLLWLIVATMALRLGWAASLETGQDEAYHFLYAVHPDWSYFDHPPMLMYIAKAGLMAFGGWIHPLSVRFGFVLMFAGSTWIMYRWTADWFGESAGFYAAVAMNLSAYYTAAAGAFVLPDGPLTFFALLTMWRLSIALVQSQPTQAQEFLSWIWVGLACGGAMLSKYHAVFLPLGALFYVVVTPSARRVLLTPGPYVACVLALLGLLPIIIWNMQHDWVSIGFQTGRAGGGKLRIDGLAVMLFGPMALLFPWIWYSLVESAIRRIIVPNGHQAIVRFLICMSVIPISLFTYVACTRPILPHWPLISFLPLFPMLGDAWANRMVTRPLFVRRWLVFMTISLLVIAGGFLSQARFGLVQFPLRVPFGSTQFTIQDPCIEISGWESVGQELVQRGIVGREKTFLFTNHWFDSGQTAFAVKNRIPVACYVQGDARGFAFWSRPDDWLGMDGILLDPENQQELPKLYEPYFREIVPLPPILMTRGGRPFRMVQVYHCFEQQQPFPFTYQRPSR